MKLIATVSLFAVLMACALRKITPENSEGKTVKAKQLELVGELSQIPKDNNMTTITAAKIEGNFLVLDVRYSGGCQEHTFRLVGNTMISKSLPPRRGIDLIHETPSPDNCKAMIMRQIKIEISQFAYKQEVGSEIFLDLAGWKGELKYAFTIEK